MKRIAWKNMWSHEENVVHLEHQGPVMWKEKSPIDTETMKGETTFLYFNVL